MSRKEIAITTQESQRQMLIIENLKEIIQKQKQELRRPLFYGVVTFGCQMMFNN